MSIGPLADDERLKMVLPQACCYCGNHDHLSVDHLIPTKRGGANTGDNLVWACRSCNSSKCASDALEWLVKKNEFPPEPLAKLPRCELLRRSIRSPGAIFVASEACPAERLT